MYIIGRKKPWAFGLRLRLTFGFTVPQSEKFLRLGLWYFNGEKNFQRVVF
jgi:hypothetical protein